MLLKLIILFCTCLFTSSAQECRLVPVCDETRISGESVSNIKGAKGSQGFAGKAGPTGPPGPPGSTGLSGPQGLPGQSVKGDKGDPGNCGATLSSLMAKLDGTWVNWLKDSFANVDCCLLFGNVFLCRSIIYSLFILV